MAEDAELQAKMTAELAEVGYRLASQGYTVKEFSEGLLQLAPILAEAWKNAIHDETLWERREERYRQVFFLGRFRWYRKFRVWKLRRSLSL